MPVTARLSKAFYDRFGDEIVAELVEWLNQVDAQYRSEFRELAESHARRIDANFERLRESVRADLAVQRRETAESIGALRQEMTESTGALRQEIAASRSAGRQELTDAISALRQDMTAGFAALSVQIADVRADLMKWSFAFWVGAVFAVATLAGVLRWTG